MCIRDREVDKRSRMFKAVQKHGRAVEFPVQNEDTLIRWVLGILKKEGKKITRGDMELFLGKTGTDMGLIDRELEKLLTYTMGRDVISAADIEAVCATQITNQIFDMVRAVSEKKQKKALGLYYDLLALKEPPMRILYLLARQFNLILQVKEMCIRDRQYDIEVYAVNTEEESKELLENLQKQGYSMVVGDMINAKLATEKGMNVVLIMSGKNSVEAVLKQAVQLLAIKSRETEEKDYLDVYKRQDCERAQARRALSDAAGRD